MNKMIEQPSATPWYRQPLVLMLILLPASVVVAGFYTLYLAISTDSGLVDDDYYEHGLAINRILDRDHAAQRYGLQGRLTLERAQGKIDLQLGAKSTAPAVTPERVELKFLHATRAGLDQVVTLVRKPDGRYQGVMPTLGQGHWYLQLSAADWRLNSDMHEPADRVAEFAPVP